MWFIIILIPIVVAVPSTLLLFRSHLGVGFFVRAFAEFYIVFLYLTLAIAGLVLRALFPHLRDFVVKDSPTTPKFNIISNR